MRGILINAEDGIIHEITLPDITYDSLVDADEDGTAGREEGNYEAHNAEMKKLLLTDIVEAVRLGPVQLWVDEEGLLRPQPGPFFRLGRPGAWGPIISKRGILLGCQGPEGDPSDFPFELGRAVALTHFLPEGTKFVKIETRESIQEHPVFGPVNAITQVSIFETASGERIEQ